MTKIVFILPTYPEVMYSFLLAFAKQKKAQIKIVCLKGLLQERKGIFANDELADYAELTFYQEETDFDRFINDVIRENREAVFVFGGFLGQVGRALQAYREQSGKQGIIITEKPSFVPVKHCNWLVKRLKNIRAKRLYANAYRQNAEAIRAVMVTGKKGVEQFRSYGIPAEKLYNFMYTHIEENIPQKTLPVGEKIRFVYVGRFAFLDRGMDHLIKTFSHLPKNNWTLDLVGGYGKDAEKVITWSRETPNVNYIGAWKSNEVIANLQAYDVCISPTRLDGWRIQVNQAIMAGIGTITTEEAVSDELVKASQTGLVVDAFRPKALYRAVLQVLEHPEMVNTWKENAKAYQNRISNEEFANYFGKVIASATGETPTRHRGNGR